MQQQVCNLHLGYIYIYMCVYKLYHSAEVYMDFRRTMPEGEYV